MNAYHAKLLLTALLKSALETKLVLDRLEADGRDELTAQEEASLREQTDQAAAAAAHAAAKL